MEAIELSSMLLIAKETLVVFLRSVEFLGHIKVV